MTPLISQIILPSYHLTKKYVICVKNVTKYITYYYISIMKKIADRLISYHSKFWLADKLGISRPTLDTRLEKNNWKKSEIALLKQLDKIILV
jgi:hypothetical protein